MIEYKKNDGSLNDTTSGTIVCYGASNTYGYDPADYSTLRYPKEKRWTTILEKMSEWTVINEGLCGREIPHEPAHIDAVLRLLAAWSKEMPPVKLWIMLGTNDLLSHPDFNAKDVAERMRNFLLCLMQDPSITSHRIKLRFICPPPMQQGTWTNERRLIVESRHLGKEYASLAHELSLPYTDTTSWDLPVVFDGVHLSEEGNRIFAENMYKELQKDSE